LSCPLDKSTIKTMKLTLILLIASTTIGCTVYPKNYTYNPNVTVSGNGQPDVQLPNPFAKSHKQQVTVTKTYRTISDESGPEPSVLNTYITPPPHSVNYYYAEETPVVYYLANDNDPYTTN
jgi:hypothetical protein